MDVRPSEFDPPEARAHRERLAAIVAREVRSSRVLAAMDSIPRHLFVPEHPLAEAYEDRPLPIGHGATISQPSLVGIMSEALALTGSERVLEVGSGSGYQAAVLCRLARRVDSVEIVPALVARAERILATVGCANVFLHQSDGWAGWAAGAPYDRIVVTAAPEVLPTVLLDQLVDGGLLLVPVGPQTKNQRLERWWKRGGRIDKEDLGAVRFVPMVRSETTQEA